jgi:hypothetical protein
MKITEADTVTTWLARDWWRLVYGIDICRQTANNAAATVESHLSAPKDSRRAKRNDRPRRD